MALVEALPEEASEQIEIDSFSSCDPELYEAYIRKVDSLRDKDDYNGAVPPQLRLDVVPDPMGGRDHKYRTQYWPKLGSYLFNSPGNYTYRGINEFEASKANDLPINSRTIFPPEPLPLQEFQLEHLLDIEHVNETVCFRLAPKENAFYSTNIRDLVRDASRNSSPTTQHAHVIGLLAAYFALEYQINSGTSFTVPEVAGAIGMLRALGSALQARYMLSEDQIIGATSYQMRYAKRNMKLWSDHMVSRPRHYTSFPNAMESYIKRNLYRWDHDRERFHEPFIETCEGLTNYVTEVPPHPEDLQRYVGDHNMAPVFQAYKGLRRSILAYRGQIMASEPRFRRVLREQFVSIMRMQDFWEQRKRQG